MSTKSRPTTLAKRKLHSIAIGKYESTKRNLDDYPMTTDKIAKGLILRKLDIINEARELGEELMEVWE